MKHVLLSVLSAILLTHFASAQDPPAPRVGDPAPDFALPFATKDSVGDGNISLQDFIGKRVVVLAFYPADWSSGCTKEMCTMRDNFKDLSTLNAEVLGISGDYQFSHHEWAKYHSLPFPLLSDHTHAVAQRYASYNKENGFNKRTVFVIDKQGKIAYVDLEYRPGGTDSFKKLQSAIAALNQ